MKSILAAPGFLIVVIFHSCNGSAKPNDEYQKNRKTYHLNGKVKSIIEFNYKQYIPDSGQAAFVTKEYYKFDAAGNCTELTTFVQHESFKSRYAYKYDAAGNYTELISYKQDSSLDSRMTYSFDNDGNVTDISDYDRSGRMGTREQHTYGPNRSFEEILYGVERKLAITYRYTYDSQGRTTSSDYYYKADKEPRKRTVWLYSGDTTRETEYDGKGSVIVAKVRVYDKDKRLIAYTVDPRWKEKTESYYKYDASGNELECITGEGAEINMEGSYRYKYTYDKTGNWIKRIAYKADGSLKSSIERRIEYY